MLELNNITLVAVACIRVEETIKALKYSTRDIKYGAIKLLTNENIIDEQIEIVKINKLNYIQYNHFIIYELYKYIDTDFVLIIQDDGFVINVNSWKNEFLNYDYIGAPWALPKDNFSYRDAFNNLVRVGNGGFSLRSKKLLKLATDLNLVWESFHGYWNEDGFFTCKNRHIYEQNNCIFAPLDIARFFSHEAPIPENEGIDPFGFHGKGSKYNVLK